VGVGKAMEIIQTGGDVSSEEAPRIGLIERRAAPDRVIAAARNIAEAIRAFRDGRKPRFRGR
jgi:enoyl-CoA hydratase/carnithine racemase